MRKWLRKCAWVSFVLLLAQPLGCGTLLYRERVGQARGKLDVVVVLLDSIGLVYFVAPGLVAFAVDFATGAIYLPRREEPPLAEAASEARAEARTSRAARRSRAKVAAQKPPQDVQIRMLGERSRDPRAIEQALREATGVELAGRWDEVAIVSQGAEGEPLARRLLALDAQAQSCAGLDPAAEPRAPAFRSCARR